MMRTAIACAALVLLSYVAGSRLTDGFDLWTAEGARRQAVIRAPVAAPTVLVTGPGIVAQPLTNLLADRRGATLVDFVYTRCETICASLGTVFQQLQARLHPIDDMDPNGERVRLLSISFDREYDGIDVLQRYAERMRADPSVWRFATAVDAAGLEQLLTSFQVVVIPDGLGGFQHNAALLVVDARGRLVRIFDYDEVDQALAEARSLTQTGASRSAMIESGTLPIPLMTPTK